MKQTHSFKHCYALLQISFDCNVDDLKKSYRALIRKWHPDQFKNDEEKALATDKVKDINIAYQQLTKHYKKYGTLPLFAPAEAKPTVSHPQTNKKSTRFKSPKRTQFTKINKKGNRAKSYSLYVFAITIIFVSYQYLDSIVMDIVPPINTPKEVNSINNTSMIDTKSKIKQKSIPKREVIYFTYGSTIGDVISIQGPPDNIVGNIWFYGKSEIHFKDGLVIKWYRTVGSPLKAQAILILKKKTISQKSIGFR